MGRYYYYQCEECKYKGKPSKYDAIAEKNFNNCKGIKYIPITWGYIPEEINGSKN